MLRKNAAWYLCMALSSIVALLVVGGWLWFFSQSGTSTSKLSEAREVVGQSLGELLVEQVAQVFASDQGVDLVLRRHYVCGEVVEEWRHLDSVTPEELISQYPDWTILSREPGKVVLATHIQDLAPQCKTNGFFGITDEGLMTFFLGPPNEGKVVKTFYQIDMEKLRSSLPKEFTDQLKDGIRVTTLAEYESVLSTYGEFVMEDTSSRK